MGNNEISNRKNSGLTTARLNMNDSTLDLVRSGAVSSEKQLNVLQEQDDLLMDFLSGVDS